MRKLIIILFLGFGMLSAATQGFLPDLANSEDLQKLGEGKIIEKDNCIIKRVTLKEIKDHWVIYIKDASLHDKHMEYIKRIEFPNSKWGKIKIEFPNNKPEASFLVY